MAIFLLNPVAIITINHFILNTDFDYSLNFGWYSCASPFSMSFYFKNIADCIS